jgi:positive regulator of sigma E activity
MNEFVTKDELGLSTHRLMAVALARLFFGLFTVLVIAIVQGFHFGFRQRDYLFLALGAAVSFVCAFAYSCVGIARANGREKQAWMFFAICSGWLPYLFLMYVIFYRGAWALVRLFSSFSWSALFAALVFIAVGLFAIRYLQTITDVVRNVREGVGPEY